MLSSQDLDLSDSFQCRNSWHILCWVLQETVAVREGSKLVMGIVARRRLVAGSHIELCIVVVVASLCHLLSEESGITKQSICAVD